MLESSTFVCAPTIAADPPDSVTDMPPPFFAGFFRYVLSMGDRLLSAVQFKVHIAAILRPEVSDRLEIIARGIENQMVMQTAIGVEPFSHTDIYQLLAFLLSMFTEQANEVIQTPLCDFLCFWECFIIIPQGYEEVAPLEVALQNQP